MRVEFFGTSDRLWSIRWYHSRDILDNDNWDVKIVNNEYDHCDYHYSIIPGRDNTIQIWTLSVSDNGIDLECGNNTVFNVNISEICYNGLEPINPEEIRNIKFFQFDENDYYMPGT